MLIVRWTRPAENDLKRINKRIAAHSAVNADQLLHSIMAKADERALYSRMGRQGRVPGTRELLVHPHYLPVYRTIGTDVKILALKHTSQQSP